MVSIKAIKVKMMKNYKNENEFITEYAYTVF